MDSEQKRIGILLLYIGILISLLVTVISTLTLSFSGINYLLMPDSFMWHDYRYGFLDSLPASVAFFIVGFFVLIVLSRKVRAFERASEVQGVWYSLSQTVIMLVLGISLAAVLVSLGILLEGILSGDVELAFLLKLLSVVLVGSAVFYYYRGVLKKRWRSHVKEERVFVSCITVFAVVLISFAVVLLDPLHRQDLNTTFSTLEYLVETQRSVSAQVKDKKGLPDSIDEVSNDFYRYWTPSDPIEGFSYTKNSPTSYTLCAFFPILPRGVDLKRYPYTEFPVSKEGENCFTLSVVL